jgi:hypothetical protein
MATVTDLKLDADTGGLVVEGGDFVIIEDLDVVAQRLRLVLRTVLGEWFLDTTHGVDYFGTILVKGAQQSRVESELRTKILAVPNVLALARFDATYDTELRRFSLVFEVSTDFGTVTIGTAVPP